MKRKPVIPDFARKAQKKKGDISPSAPRGPAAPGAPRPPSIKPRSTSAKSGRRGQ